MAFRREDEYRDKNRELGKEVARQSYVIKSQAETIMKQVQELTRANIVIENLVKRYKVKPADLKKIKALLKK